MDLQRGFTAMEKHLASQVACFFVVAAFLCYAKEDQERFDSQVACFFLLLFFFCYAKEDEERLDS